jgi:hypothetical protein
MAEEWDVFQMLPGTTEPEFLATLYDAYHKEFRPERDGCGSASFAINRTSDQTTETILAQGNLVKIRVPEIDDDYIFAFFLETGDFTLISSDEEGGEMLTFGGRGILSYLEYARAASESFIDGGMSPIAGLWNAYLAGTGAAPGQILRRLIEEFQHADRVYPVAASHPIPHLTIDFDYDVDSTGDPWDVTDATDEFKYMVGEDGLAIIQRLIDTETIVVQMDPDFTLHAYNPANYGRDLTGAAFGVDVVRFERGVNIAIELRRELAVDRVVTHVLVQGEADQYGGAVLADAGSQVTKEGFLATYGVGATALNGLGAVDLQQRLMKSDLIQFPINNRRTVVDLGEPVTVGAVASTPGLAAAGFYLPGPEGTNGDFWLGDTTRLHTGTGPFDYSEVDGIVRAITITREDDNHELVIIPELRGVPTPLPTPQMFTHVQSAGCNTGQWPEGSPGAGLLLVGVAVQRGNTLNYTAGSVPIGNVGPVSSCVGADIAGTEWDYLGSVDVNTDEYPQTMAMRFPSVVGEPEIIRWGGAGGYGATGPRSYQIALVGMDGTEDGYTSSVGFGNTGTVFTSHAYTISAPGIIIASIMRRSAGPADGSSPAYTFAARAPAQDLMQGYANSGFAPNSWFGMIEVTPAMFAVTPTYSITLDCSAIPRNPGDPWSWQMNGFPFA